MTKSSHVTQGNDISSAAEENIFIITTCNGQPAKRKKKEGRRKENIECLHVTIGCLLNRTAHNLAEIRSPGIGGSDVLA